VGLGVGALVAIPREWKRDNKHEEGQGEEPARLPSTCPGPGPRRCSAAKTPYNATDGIRNRDTQLEHASARRAPYRRTGAARRALHCSPMDYGAAGVPAAGVSNQSPGRCKGSSGP
jgi:hypothetical protein